MASGGGASGGAVGRLLRRGVLAWMTGLVGALLTGVALTVIAVPAVRAPVERTVCAPEYMQTMCGRMGLGPLAPDAPDRSRAALMGRIVGLWGRQDRACAEGTVRYVTERRGEDDYVIVTAEGYRTESQVVAAEGDAIVVRENSGDGARPQWEFRPDGDRLSLIDKDGVATVLVRCD